MAFRINRDWRDIAKSAILQRKMQLSRRLDSRKMRSFTVCKLIADSAVISFGYETVQNMSAFEAAKAQIELSNPEKSLVGTIKAARSRSSGWQMTGIDPFPAARELWLQTHPLKSGADSGVGA